MGDRLKPLDFVWARWQLCVPDANRVCAVTVVPLLLFAFRGRWGGSFLYKTCAPALQHGSHSCAVDASPPDGAQRSCLASSGAVWYRLSSRRHKDSPPHLDELCCQEGLVGQEIVKSHSADARSRGFHRTSLDGAPQFVMYVLDVQCLALSVVPLVDSRFMHRACLLHARVRLCLPFASLLPVAYLWRLWTTCVTVSLVLNVDKACRFQLRHT